MGFVRYLKNQFRHDRNIKHALEADRQLLESINNTVLAIRCQQRIDYLREKTLNSKASGVSDEKYCECEVIVSLTSFGRRIYDSYLAIESIMQGSMKPNRIILWLAKDEFEGSTLPRMLQLQQSRGLEIKYCEDLRSYKKLVPSLTQHPDACIITIDDDLMYDFDIVERLINTHLKRPRAICACRVHRIRLNNKQSVTSYLDWDFCVSNSEEQSPLLFPTTGGGALYPPHCLSEEVLNKEAFMRICPFADDVWFYTMGLLKGTLVVQTYTGKPEGYYIELPSSSIDALSVENTNTLNCRNDIQIKAVFEKYNIYEKLL